VPSEDQWPMSNQPIIEPPQSRATPGRPRKIRYRRVKEPKNPNTMRKGETKTSVGIARNGVTINEFAWQGKGRKKEESKYEIIINPLQELIGILIWLVGTDIFLWNCVYVVILLIIYYVIL
jgi:hypothetical protein